MNAKQVWAVILIVMGVIFVIKGFLGYSETTFYGSEIEAMNLLMKKYAGASENEIFNIGHSRIVIQNSKAVQIIIIAFGIISAVCGTAILQSNDQQVLAVDFDDIDDLPSIHDKWRM